MKVRIGFVSNSSSSSFLVAFPKNPKTKKELQKMVFGDAKQFNHPYEITHYPVEQIVDMIWQDINKQIPNNRKIILSKIDNILLEDYDKYYIPAPGKEHWELDYDHEQYREDNNSAVMEFMNSYPGHYFYYFTYCDGNGSMECAMEHGQLFNLLPHLVSSKH